MKGVVKLDDDYFLKYKDKPVKIMPFDPESKALGLDLVREIEVVLEGIDCEISLRGSTLFEISGKGDIEVGIYTENLYWEEVLKKLKNRFGEPDVIEEQFVKISFKVKERDFEIMMFRGRSAIVDKRLSEYLVASPDLLKEYEEVKKKYSFSRRDYNRGKNRFLRRVEAEILEKPVS